MQCTGRYPTSYNNGLEVLAWNNLLGGCGHKLDHRLDKVVLLAYNPLHGSELSSRGRWRVERCLAVAAAPVDPA